jgi:hypothetical protein
MTIMTGVVPVIQKTINIMVKEP